MIRYRATRTASRRRNALLAGVLAVVLLVTGCGDAGFSGLYNAPLPGGADLGDDPYRVTAQFSDVLDLVPQASVKVNDVAVGRVERVTLAKDTKSAVVHLIVNGDVRLPANAVAELRQSSLLGEKFVDLRPPPGTVAAPRGRLSDGAHIPLSATSRHAELEEVFGALSLLLSGGGIEQIHSIARELNAALSGNEPEIKALLRRLDHMVTELDGQKGRITSAIDGLNTLAKTLVREKANLEKSLDELAPGVRVVAEQTDDIVDMLTALQRLSDVSVETIGKSRKQIVANLKALEPTIRKLADADDDLIEALKIVPTYPLPWNAGDTMKGDFANVDVEFDMNLDQLLANMQNSSQQPVELPPEASPEKGTAGPDEGLLPGLPGGRLPDLGPLSGDELDPLRRLLGGGAG